MKSDHDIDYLIRQGRRVYKRCPEPETPPVRPGFSARVLRVRDRGGEEQLLGRLWLRVSLAGSVVALTISVTASSLGSHDGPAPAGWLEMPSVASTPFDWFDE